MTGIGIRRTWVGQAVHDNGRTELIYSWVGLLSNPRVRLHRLHLRKCWRSVFSRSQCVSLEAVEHKSIGIIGCRPRTNYPISWFSYIRLAACYSETKLFRWTAYRQDNEGTRTRYGSRLPNEERSTDTSNWRGVRKLPDTHAKTLTYTRTASIERPSTTVYVYRPIQSYIYTRVNIWSIENKARDSRHEQGVDKVCAEFR